MGDGTVQRKKTFKVMPLPEEATIRGIVDRWEAQLKKRGKKEKISTAPKKGRGRDKAKRKKPKPKPRLPGFPALPSERQAPSNRKLW